ncbi:hypothetical protein SLA2020_290780 [Shorea laevis]
MGTYEGSPKVLVFAAGQLAEQVAGIAKVITWKPEKAEKKLGQEKVALGFSCGFEQESVRLFQLNNCFAKVKAMGCGGLGAWRSVF